MKKILFLFLLISINCMAKLPVQTLAFKNAANFMSARLDESKAYKVISKSDNIYTFQNVLDKDLQVSNWLVNQIPQMNGKLRMTIISKQHNQSTQTLIVKYRVYNQGVEFNMEAKATPKLLTLRIYD